MANVKCPYCSSRIELDKSQYNNILKQELNYRFDQELHKNEFLDNSHDSNLTTNIYVDEETYKKLDQNAIEFGFTRTQKDGSIIANKNAFISEIMINYYDDFTAEEAQKKAVIEDTLMQNIPLLNDYSAQKIASYIMGGMDTLASEKIKQKKHIIKLKQTKANESIYSEIQLNKFNSNSISSISQFYYSMFQAFFKKPQYVRERIIFKKKFNELNKYMENGDTILIKYKSDPAYRNFYPYKIVHSPEENHNYLLGVEKTKDKNNPNQIITLCVSYRIDNIGSIIKRSFNPIQITESQKQALDETDLYSPSSAQQVPGEHIIVALNKTGVSLLSSIYTFKPVRMEIIKTIDSYVIYKVYGSKFQAKIYFKRFGANAIILNDSEFMQEQIAFANQTLQNYTNLICHLEEEL